MGFIENYLTMEQELGRKIKQLRGAKGWSQGVLGEKMGLGYVQIGRYEKGTATPTVEQLKKLSQLLDYDLISHMSKEKHKGPESVELVTGQADTYQDKYIKLLEQQVAVLNTAIQNNLTALSGSQQTTLAMLRAHVRNEAMIRAKGDPAKAEKEMEQINRYAFEYQGVQPEKGIVGHSRGKG